MSAFGLSVTEGSVVKRSDIVLVVLLVIIAAGAVKAVFLPRQVPPDTQESPLFRETLGRSLHDFTTSETVVDPYKAIVPAAAPAPPVQGDNTAQPQPPAPQASLEQGAALFQAGQLDQAAALLEQLRKADPKDANVGRMLGGCYLYLGRTDDALAAYRAAAEASPDDPVSYHYVGNVYRQVGKDADADAAFRKAIELSPGDTIAHMRLGEIYAARGEHEKALAEYQHEIKRLKALLEQAPDDPKAQGQLALFYVDHDTELAAGLELARKAAQALPDDNPTVVAFSRLLHKSGQTPAAIELLEKVIAREAQPGLKQYYQMLLKSMQPAPPKPNAP
jgi:tetratricopeptide (TPR) repeat protein